MVRYPGSQPLISSLCLLLLPRTKHCLDTVSLGQVSQSSEIISRTECAPCEYPAKVLKSFLIPKFMIRILNRQTSIWLLSQNDFPIDPPTCSCKSSPMAKNPNQLCLPLQHQVGTTICQSQQMKVKVTADEVETLACSLHYF